MNILMVSNEYLPDIGGIQTHVDELSRALVVLGHQVDIITRHKHHDLPSTEERQGVHVHRIPLAKNHLLYDWQLLRKARSLVSNRQVELCHVHGMRPLEAIGKLNLPLVFTNHTSSFMKRFQQGASQRRKMARVLANAYLVTAPSHLLVDATRETGYSGPVEFVPNGVDEERFCPASSNLRENLGIPEDAFILLFAGRLHPVKGTQTLVRLLPELPKDCHLLIAGDGAERSMLEVEAKKVLPAQQLHFLGAVGNEKMPAVYRTADLLLLPSRMEATSISGLEAMSCGLPVVGSRVGGIPLIVEDGKNGILCNVDDVEPFSTAIMQLYQNRPLRENMGNCSRQRVLDQFTWRQVAEKMLQLYRQSAEI